MNESYKWIIFILFYQRLGIDGLFLILSEVYFSVANFFFLFSHKKVPNIIYIIMNYKRGQKKGLYSFFYLKKKVPRDALKSRFWTIFGKSLNDMLDSKISLFIFFRLKVKKFIDLSGEITETSRVTITQRCKHKLFFKQHFLSLYSDEMPTKFFEIFLKQSLMHRYQNNSWWLYLSVEARHENN